MSNILKIKDIINKKKICCKNLIINVFLNLRENTKVNFNV